MARFYLNNFIPTNKSMSIFKCLIMKIHFKKSGDLLHIFPQFFPQSVSPLLLVYFCVFN